MTNQITTATFDYSRLDEETASKLKYYTQSGSNLVKKTGIQFIANFGEILSDARKLLTKHGDGTFCKWATSEFDLSRQTVYNYVNAWDRCLSNGFTNFDNVTPTALYLLSRDDTPKSVREQTLRLAHKQHSVTKSDVSKLLPPGEKRKPRNPKPPASVVTPPPVDYGKCPNCLGTKWKPDDDGMVCAKCLHPHGEPAGDVDDDRLKIQRSKTVKTAEALMRAFDDLHDMKARVDRDGAIEECQKLMALARAW